MRTRGTAALVAGVLAVGLVAPAAAGADIELPVLPDIPTPSLPSPSEAVGSVLRTLFELLFGDIPKKITKDVLHWLLTHPSFGEDTRFESLRAGGASMRDVAYALAIAATCAGLVRGLFDDVTTAAVEASRRFVFVLGAITLWPWIFDMAIRFSNLATELMLEVPQISNRTTALLGFAFLTGAATGIGFICGFLAAVLLIGLFLQKVLALSALAVLYVLGPVLIAMHPFPPTSHLIGVGAAALTALLVINPIWTGLLVVFALVSEGALTVGASAVEDFLEPVMAVAMLLLVLAALPMLIRLAWARGLVGSLMTPVGSAPGGQSMLATATTARAMMSSRADAQRSSSRQLMTSAWLPGPAGPAAALAGGAAGAALTGGAAAAATAAGTLPKPAAALPAAGQSSAPASPPPTAPARSAAATASSPPPRTPQLFPDTGPAPPFLGGEQEPPPPFMGGSDRGGRR